MEHVDQSILDLLTPRITVAPESMSLLSPRSIAGYFAGSWTENHLVAVEAAAARSFEGSMVLFKGWKAIESLRSKVVEPRLDSEQFEILCEWLKISKGYGNNAASSVSRPIELIGRDTELYSVIEALGNENVRIVNVYGVQGVGKSAIVNATIRSLAAFNELPVWKLCKVGAQSLQAVVSEAWIEVDPTVSPSGLSELIEEIGAKSALMVIDTNQSGQTAKFIESLVAECLDIRFLVTGHSPIANGASINIEIVPFNQTDNHGSAVEIFLSYYKTDSTRIDEDSIDPSDIAEICRLSGGVPRQIVRAAQRASLTSIPALKLEMSDLQKGGHREGHSVARTVVLASLNELEETDKEAIAKLCSFSGMFTLDQAARVSELEVSDATLLLRRLGARSLVEIELVGGAVAYRVLNKPMLASLGLNASSGWQIGRFNHASYYIQIAEGIADRLKKGHWHEAARALSQNLPEIEAAIDYCISHGIRDGVSSLAVSLLGLLLETGRNDIFEPLAKECLELAVDAGDTGIEARMCGFLGAAASRGGDEESCTGFWKRRADICARLGDLKGYADSINDLAAQALELRQYEHAIRLSEEAETAAWEAEVPELVATSWVIRGRAFLAKEQGIRAKYWMDQAMELIQTCSNHDMTLYVYQSLAIAFESIGDYIGSESCARFALGIAVEGERETHIGIASRRLAEFHASRGEIETACILLLQSIDAFRNTGSRHRFAVERELNRLVEREPARATTTIEAYRSMNWRQILHESSKF